VDPVVLDVLLPSQDGTKLASPVRLVL
jgi:hypothetical protein